jgi:hypothetical protein
MQDVTSKQFVQKSGVYQFTYQLPSGAKRNIHRYMDTNTSEFDIKLTAGSDIQTLPERPEYPIIDSMTIRSEIMQVNIVVLEGGVE